MRSQIVISNQRGGRRYPPYAFTEQGVAMLSSVLRSPRAVEVNIEIMRAFVRLRGFIVSNEALSAKLKVLERKYDARFKVVFEVRWPPRSPHRLATPFPAPRPSEGALGPAWKIHFRIPYKQK